MVTLDLNDKGIDIHHIFPRKWCEDRNIPPPVFNSIINKTAISYKANRKIGGNAPSQYLIQLETDPAVQLAPSAMDQILWTHYIDPNLLRADDFDAFFHERRIALLTLLEQAMGKPIVATNEPTAEDSSDIESDVESDMEDE